jgi:hypothetical protein
MFLTKWLQGRELNKAKHNSDLQLITVNSYQFNSQVQLQIKMQELELSTKAQELRFRIGLNDVDLEHKRFELQKSRDELERVKAEFRIHLDGQRADIELKREKFEREQDREDKVLEQNFYLSKAQLQIQAQQVENNFQLEWERLQLLREQQEMEKARLEGERIEKSLTAMLTSFTTSNEMRHSERLKELETMYKEFELQLSFIKLYSADQQAQEYENLRTKLQQRMNAFFGTNNGGVNGEY